MSLARAAELLAARGLLLGAPLVLAEETRSTNDDAKEGAKRGAPHGALWIAESQTAGRGRQGRAWVSARGEDLLFSVLLRLRCAPARVPPLSLVCGLAVRDAVARALGAAFDGDVLVKWPNDVLVRRGPGGALRKVAGILVESALVGMKVESVVVGVGINVHGLVLPPELATIATTLAVERGARVASPAGAASDAGPAPPAGPAQPALDRAELLADVLAGLERDVERVAHEGLGVVHARLTRHDALAGREIESAEPGTELRGTACGIDAEGRLLVRTEGGVVVPVSSGELRVRALAQRQ
jgi:BirA family biotin operon repressor/biotin-[acetyl-CoA-carboxylase] ligase